MDGLSHAQTELTVPFVAVAMLGLERVWPGDQRHLNRTEAEVSAVDIDGCGLLAGDDEAAGSQRFARAAGQSDRSRDGLRRGQVPQRGLDAGHAVFSNTRYGADAGRVGRDGRLVVGSDRLVPGTEAENSERELASADDNAEIPVFDFQGKGLSGSDVAAVSTGGFGGLFPLLFSGFLSGGSELCGEIAVGSFFGTLLDLFQLVERWAAREVDAFVEVAEERQGNFHGFRDAITVKVAEFGGGRRAG